MLALNSELEEVKKQEDERLGLGKKEAIEKILKAKVKTKFFLLGHVSFNNQFM